VVHPDSGSIEISPGFFFSKGCRAELREEAKGILQVTNESLNDKYLGLPSDVGKSKMVLLNI
jgi:hypothetical protein